MRRVTIVAAAFLLVSWWSAAQPTALAAAAKPNIVIFYLDDVSPHDGRLWNDPQRTPAIYDTFIAHGIHFTHAFGEDPLCCPARGTVLSGLHTHNNGLDNNDARLYSPQESVPKELQGAGYSTMWIGKYMNRNSYLSPAGWAAHMDPWDVFDGIYGLNGGDFYNYTLRTKDQGDIVETTYHSTAMVMDRAVSRFAAAPANKPIFAVLSMYNMHAPNVPMPITPEQSAMCDNVAPYLTPNYNEADVSDKPAYLRNLPLLPNASGWPMGGYCREMFGVDTVVKRVTDELSAEGRLDNTLLVFTADNGMSWGAHRRGQQKHTPDSTALPLYMVWPAGWGTTPRDINEYTSNIDLAPTFCELGGCTLGPYSSGQSGPDGLSLVSLVGQGTSLGRDAILEQSPQPDPELKVPAWWSIRTTSQSPLGLWRFTEYATGERELYDEADDPWELNNLASDPGHSAIQTALAQRLTGLLNEGRVNRPDLSLWGKKQKLYRFYAGYNLFDSAATPEQTLNLTIVPRITYLLLVNVKNNKLSSDSFMVTANVVGGSRVVIHWLLDKVDVTTQMNSGGIQINSLPGTTTMSLTLQVTVKKPYPKTTSTRVDIHAASIDNPNQDDDVLLVMHK
ncbi:MAG: sulfatase-like hydrolase/transferase [Chloroflexota bacterium]